MLVWASVSCDVFNFSASGQFLVPFQIRFKYNSRVHSNVKGKLGKVK